MASANCHDTPIMLYGFHHHTAVWSGRARASADLASWVHVPAKNLINLLETLSQFPKLEILVVDVFNELLKEIDPLSLTSSLTESAAAFYNPLERAFDLIPKLKVISTQFCPVFVYLLRYF